MKKLINSLKSFSQIIRQLNYILNKKQKKRSIKVFINIIIASAFDMLGVAAILPFITALTNINTVKKQWYTQIFVSLFKIESDTVLMIIIGLGIILIYVVKNVYLFIYQCVLIKYQCNIQEDVSFLMLKSYMSRPYSFFKNTNSAVVLRGIDLDANALYYIISNLFSIMSQILTIILVCWFLIRQDVTMAVGIMSASFVCILLIVFCLKSISLKAGKRFLDSNSERLSSSYQIVNGIKEIFVMQRKEPFTDKYEKAYKKYTSSLITKNEVSALPVRLIETIVVGFIIGIVCVKLALGMNPMDYVPQLATFAVAGFRLIPMVTAIPTCMNELIFYEPMLNEAYENIKSARQYSAKIEKSVICQNDNSTKLQFEKCIDISNLCYRFEDADSNVIENLSLVITPGESIGIVGESGAGKSTLIDIIMGLQMPSSGKITVDGHDIYSIPGQWSRMIGYIPQSVFLLDDTIRNNVVFGSLAGDDDKVWKALDEANLRQFIMSLPNGLDTIVGEQGVRLSGGQRQRIAIARALYYNPSIIVMDEATSALDNDTEKVVMESVDAMQGEKTLIIVAHRLSTISHCNHIYEMKNKKLVERSYEGLF